SPGSFPSVTAHPVSGLLFKTTSSFKQSGICVGKSMNKMLTVSLCATAARRAETGRKKRAGFETLKARSLQSVWIDCALPGGSVLLPVVIDVLDIVVVFQHVDQLLHVGDVLFLFQHDVILGHHGYIGFKEGIALGFQGGADVVEIDISM